MCKYFITKGGGGLVMPADTLPTYCSGLDTNIWKYTFWLWHSIQIGDISYLFTEVMRASQNIWDGETLWVNYLLIEVKIMITSITYAGRTAGALQKYESLAVQGRALRLRAIYGPFTARTGHTGAGIPGVPIHVDFISIFAHRHRGCLWKNNRKKTSSMNHRNTRCWKDAAAVIELMSLPTIRCNISKSYFKLNFYMLFLVDIPN